MQMAEISTFPNTDSGDCGKPQVRSRQKHESGELFRWCQCFDPKERLAGLRMFVLLTTALTQVRAIISTEGALRLPTTYDNHPIPSTQPIPLMFRLLVMFRGITLKNRQGLAETNQKPKKNMVLR